MAGEKERKEDGRIATDRSIDVNGDFGESKIIESQRTIEVRDGGVGGRKRGT